MHANGEHRRAAPLDHPETPFEDALHRRAEDIDAVVG
jgi:hypothetical protein